MQGSSTPDRLFWRCTGNLKRCLQRCFFRFFLHNLLNSWHFNPKDQQRQTLSKCILDLKKLLVGFVVPEAATDADDKHGLWAAQDQTFSSPLDVKKIKIQAKIANCPMVHFRLALLNDTAALAATRIRWPQRHNLQMYSTGLSKVPFPPHPDSRTTLERSLSSDSTSSESSI